MKYYLGLGGNIGETAVYFRKALELIGRKGLGRVILKSSLYKTEPVGGPGQDWYLNAATMVESDLGPEEMMGGLAAIEEGLGRKRNGLDRNLSRTIDLDILMAGDIIINVPELILPHPRMAKRRFALEPLAEIAPDLVHPVLKKRICDLLAESGDGSQVEKLGERL